MVKILFRTMVLEASLQRYLIARQRDIWVFGTKVQSKPPPQRETYPCYLVNQGNSELRKGLEKQSNNAITVE